MTILLVDSGREFCLTLEHAFRQARPGTVVFSHGDGQRAIEHLALCGERYPLPDLLLVNQSLPDGPDGHAVLRTVRALTQFGALPVIMLGPSNEPQHKAQAHEVGADGYIAKPWEKDAYPGLAQEVLHWWEVRREQHLLRGWCAGSASERSLQPAAPLTSGPAMMLPVPPNAASLAVPAHTPLVQIHDLLQSFFGYVAGGALPETKGLFADRKLTEISRACREEGIEEMDATGHSQDPVLVRKRGRVVRRLMTLEWSDTELLRRFRVKKRTMQELRRVWRGEMQNGCAIVARERR